MSGEPSVGATGGEEGVAELMVRSPMEVLSSRRCTSEGAMLLCNV